MSRSQAPARRGIRALARGALRAGLAALALVGAAAARAQDAPPSDACPPGTTPREERHPDSRERWCEAPDGRSLPPSFLWDDKGQLVTSVEAAPDGGTVTRQWHSNGVPQSWSSDDGAGHQYFIWWYPNGQREREGAFVKGELDGPWTAWWPNGNLRYAYRLAAGRAVGPARFYHENGRLRSEGSFVDGRKVGIWRRWRSDGSLLREVDYADGARQDLEPPGPVD